MPSRMSRQIRRAAGACALVVMGSVACFSTGRPSRFASDRGACATAAGVVGQWRSQRGSQLGPATTTLTLQCDCTYDMRVRLLFGRFQEAGEYRIGNGRLILSRANSETTWPYEHVAGKLRIQEGADEVHEYSRTSEFRCE